MSAPAVARSYHEAMPDETDKLLVEGLDSDDLAVLSERGVDIAELVRDEIHNRAEQIRAEERDRNAYRRRVVREVAAERRTSGEDYTADQIVSDIHADRRAAGWE